MSVRTFLDGKVTLHHVDCLDVLATLPDASIDSCVTDPPYHLTSIVKRFGAEGAAEAKEGATGAFKRASRGFMGKQWDGGDIAFRSDVWREVYRVLKPGAYLLAFASTRGFGRMSVAIEDAGFITHPLVAWVFGTGFPKATRIKAEGYEGFRYGGQALKPAIEPIYMGQKPFEKGLTGTENILKWGTGALNIDGCRVATADDLNGGAYVGNERRRDEYSPTDAVDGAVPLSRLNRGIGEYKQPPGRWPANLIHDGSEEVLQAFPDSNGQQGLVDGQTSARQVYNGGVGPRPRFEPRGDTGSAARFFYSAKADSDDRLGSKHPTIKPVDLIQYLVRLVTPKGGTVLDCFAGTGTTGEAAFREGMRAILIEREAEYVEDIKRRMSLVLAGPEERARETLKARGLAKADAGPLFGGRVA